MSSSPQPPGFQQFYYAAMRVIEAGRTALEETAHGPGQCSTLLRL